MNNIATLYITEAHDFDKNTAAYSYLVQDIKGNICKHGTQSFDFTSGPRASLLALYKALKSVGVCYRKVALCTPIQFIAEGVRQKWTDTWRNNGFKTIRGTDVKHQDIWKGLIPLLKQYDIKVYPTEENSNPIIEYCANEARKALDTL